MRRIFKWLAFTATASFLLGSAVEAAPMLDGDALAPRDTIISPAQNPLAIEPAFDLSGSGRTAPSILEGSASATFPPDSLVSRTSIGSLCNGLSTSCNVAVGYGFMPNGEKLSVPIHGIRILPERTDFGTSFAAINPDGGTSFGNDAAISFNAISATPVQEPAALWLLGIGLAGLGIAFHRRRKIRIHA